jgi:hypothetical protein
MELASLATRSSRRSRRAILTAEQESDSTPLASGSPEGIDRRAKRSIWCGFGVIVLFAAGYLQFGLVECFHAPASERVNDGQHPTFFAYHIDPHGVMSEDFYLYVVRAKRILDRGWTDSPLNSRMETGRSYLAPVQALLGMIAVQTGGRPAPYSVYMACILLLGWGTLYFTAVCVLPERISTWAIVLAMMVAVLFESWRNLFGDPEFSAGIWPAERHLRMATMAWTSPWLLASIIVSVSLWFQPQGHGKRVLLLGVFLLVLGAADNWAFAIAWIAAGLSASGLGIAKLTNSRHAASWALLTGLVVVLGSSFGMQSFWAAEIRGDALLRSGFGYGEGCAKNGSFLVVCFHCWSR